MSASSSEQWNWLNPYWPDQQWSKLSDFDQKVSIFLLVIIIIIIIVLIVLEYQEQDCIPGKICHNRVEPPPSLDSNGQYPSKKEIKDYIDSIEQMVTNNYRYHIWRLSLLSGLITTIPVVYFLKGRIPLLIEWIVIGTLIFLGTYLAFSWLWAHFFYPNSHQMEQHLRQLKKHFSYSKP